VPLIHTQGLRNAQQLRWEGLLNFGLSRYTLIAEASNMKLQLWVGGKLLLDSCLNARTIDSCRSHSVCAPCTVYARVRVTLACTSRA